MAYTESVKDLERLREILLNFYVDGSKTKEEYLASFYRGACVVIENALSENVITLGKGAKSRKTISIDARLCQINPLYKLFFLKSYNKNDISLHFHIIDILSDGKKKRLSEIKDILTQRYYNFYEDSEENISENDYFKDTVRNKLNEMVSLGIVDSDPVGNRFEYYLSNDDILIGGLEDAVSFFSSSYVAGVIGEVIKEEYFEGSENEIFTYKHNYLNKILDADALCVVLSAAKDSRRVKFDYDTRSQRVDTYHFSAFPIKVYSSVSEGRQYLFSYNYSNNHYTFFRLDKIHNVEIGEVDDMAESHRAFYKENSQKIWGASISNDWSTEHVEFVLSITEDEKYVLSRLLREKRNCTVTDLGDSKYLVSTDVINPKGMLPWIRTFYGRLEAFSSSDKSLEKDVKEDIKVLKEYYDAL